MINNKDFVSMKTDVAEFIGDSTTTFLTKIGKYLNARYRDSLHRYSWSQLYLPYTITTIAGTSEYALPYDFEEVVYIWDDTNKVMLWEKPEAASWSDGTLTGSSQYFTINQASQAAQPTSSSTLSVVSSSASDNTQTIFIKGISSGVEKSETITLGATTPVSSSNSYTRVDQISKSATSVGTVTVTSNSGAVTVATIPPGMMQSLYRIIKFFYIPVTTTSLIVKYKRSPLPMVNDYDYPIIDIADEIMLGAQSDAWRAKRQFAKAQKLDNMYETGLNQKIFQEEQNKDTSIEPIPYPR